MSQILAGAVNAAAAKFTAKTSGPNTRNFPIFANGVSSSIVLPTDDIWKLTSHRVAMIGGTTLGRDHFPFATPDFSTVGSPPEKHRNNIPLTLDQALEIYLRVRKWRLNITGVLLPYPPGHSMNGTGEWEMGSIYPDQDPYDRESQLVLGRPDFLTDIHPVTNTGVTNIPLQMDLMLWQLYFDGTNFFPSILVSTGGATICQTLKPGGSPGSIGSFTIILSGGATLVDSLGTYSHNGAAHSADTTLEAIEWWPYATNSGDPVYDTATGAQLRDPLS